VKDDDSNINGTRMQISKDNNMCVKVNVNFIMTLFHLHDEQSLFNCHCVSAAGTKPWKSSNKKCVVL
jgi:hypothetical protein